MKNLIDYLDEYKELLGDEFGKLNQRLKKEFLFYLVCQNNLNTCYRCNNKIINSADLSVEHKNPWKNQEEFFNLNNITFSHIHCNCGSSNSGTGKYKYIGINDYIDKRKGKDYKKIRAVIVCFNRPITVGYFDNEIDAAIAYDLGLMFYRRGEGVLNFPENKEKYKKVLNNIIRDEIRGRKNGIFDLIDNVKSM